MLFLIFIVSQTIDQNALNSALLQVQETYDQQVMMGEYQTDRVDIPAGALRQFIAGQGAYARERGDIIVGDEPGETLYVSGSYYNNGDIFVVNSGVVQIINADFNLDGSIIVMDQGEVYVDSSSFTILQHFIYHRTLSTSDSAFFSITNTTTSFNGYQVNLNVQGFGNFIMNNVVNQDWITAVVMHDAHASLENVDHMGEWLFINRCSATFKHVDQLITWYFCEDSSIIDFTFPSSDTVYGFVFDSTLANVSHVDYHVEIDSCTDCLWAMIPLRGSDVTIQDSYLRVTGLMFEGADSFDITGLVNGLFYDDYTIPIQDRSYRLVNTTIETWNLYPSDSTRVTLHNSIFGELCGFSSSYTTIQQAFCDGSGGHIEASGTATVVVFLSSIFADVISKGYGICVLGQCSMPYGRIWATGSSVMVIVNTQFPEDPIPQDTAIVFVAAVTGPSEAMVDDTVAITGSAWIGPGPYNPLYFDHYRLHYRVLGDTIWTPMGSTQTQEVHQDTLEHWITNGLDPGDYEVKLVLKDNMGDSVEAMKHIRLRPMGIKEYDYTAIESTLDCVWLRPGIFRITTSVQAPDIRIYTITGQRVDVCNQKECIWKAPASGVYFIREQSTNLTRKVIAF